MIKNHNQNYKNEKEKIVKGKEETNGLRNKIPVKAQSS